ncbi:MAG: methionyl-tRNA formyltransferase [Parcubacteria group bacterium GW2011_GWA2_38_13b]|nr:MAG: methionyl-tRNA formyltransferase [Parcubacteria group bacterium GW2011_GWA2_38_13b]
MNQKIIFFGTSDFAVPVLEALIKNKYEIIAVITQPDREAGRGYEKNISPIKETALKYGLKILQPEKLKDEEFIKVMEEISPGLNIVCSYGKIIPKEIIEIPKHKTINIHPSLLPKYRGSSPIQTTILNGDKEAGITIMLMDKEMDHGAIIENRKSKIKNQNIVTYKELSKQLAKKSAELLIKTLPEWLDGKIIPREQNHNEASFTKIFVKEDGKIYWNKTSDEIDRQTRALNPWPGTFCFWHNHETETTTRLKIIKTELPYTTSLAMADIIPNKQEGTVFKTPSGLMAIATLNNHIIIKEIQPEGKKIMAGKDFLNGYPEIIGKILT